MRHNLTGFLILLFPCLALASPISLQGHLRTGLVNGSLKGPAISGEAVEGFSSASTLEGEFEYFFGARSAFLAKATVGLDQESGTFGYIHMGVGQRFYIFSQGRPVESDLYGVTTSVKPKMRYYVDGQIGLSRILVSQRTAVLSVQTTNLELGIGGGTIYQLSDTFGIELNMMWSQGVSVSSVSYDSTVIRAMIGAVTYF